MDLSRTSVSTLETMLPSGGRTEFDFDIDPPPDLAVESDYTRSSLDRLGVYAASGFPRCGDIGMVFSKFACCGQTGRTRWFQRVRPFQESVWSI